MRKKSKVLLLLTFLAAIVAITYFVVTKHQPNVSAQQKAQKNELPIVDFTTSEPDNAEGKRLRQERGGKYEKAKQIQQSEENEFELPLAHAPAAPAFPVAQSDAVVIGTTLDAQAFLTQNKSSVYSEFAFLVEKVLMNNTANLFGSGNTISADRLGGAVRFESGKIQERGVFGQGLPREQTRYVLFLKFNEKGQNFSIITGYELTNGKAVPLDGSRQIDEFSIYKNYKRYENASESQLLAEIQQQISASVSRRSKDE